MTRVAYFFRTNGHDPRTNNKKWADALLLMFPKEDSKEGSFSRLAIVKKFIKELWTVADYFINVKSFQSILILCRMFTMTFCNRDIDKAMNRFRI